MKSSNNTTRFGKVWKTTTLVSVFILAMIAGKAQTTFNANSLIIPMDVTYQNYGMWKAYGLVYHLLSNGIPVHWSIDRSKSWNGADFPASAQDLRTPVVVISNYAYSGGPFIIDAAYAAQATILINTWWTKNANQPAVHKTTASFTAPVDMVLKSAPRIANEEINAGITIAYYNAAGIPDLNGNAWSTLSPNLLNQTEIAGGALFTSGTCNSRNFDIFVTPHNSGYAYDVNNAADLGTLTYDALDDFVMNGGGWLALCHSILSNENAIRDLYNSTNPAVRALFTAPPSVNGGFLTQTGFSTISNTGGTWGVLKPGLPLSQAVSTTAVQALPGGSVQNWPRNSVTYWPETERVARFLSSGVEYDWAINGVVHNGTGSGKMTYLGGHSYSTSLPYATNYEAPYLRFFYNALFFNGAAVAKLALVPSPASVPQSTTTPVGLQLRNTGSSVASLVNTVKVTLPIGVTYVSTTGTAPTSVTGGGGSPTVISWSTLPDAAPNALLLTVNVSVNFSSLGTNKIADFEAKFGDVYAESFTVKTCHTVQVTSVPLPVITKLPASQGPYYRGQTATWTLTYSNSGDVQLLNSVVEDLLPVGLTYKSASPSPLSVVPLPGGTTRVRWSTGNLNAHSTPQPIILNAYVGGSPGTVTNTATLTGQDAGGRSYSASASAEVIIGTPEISVVKSVDITETNITTPGATLTYTIRPLYDGSALLDSVIIADPVPAYTGSISGTASDGGKLGFTPLVRKDATENAGSGTGTASSRIISVTPSLIVAGGTVNVTLRLVNKSGDKIAGIEPSLRDARSGYEYSPSSTGFDLNNNDSVVVIFSNCQVNDIGEMRFEGDATGTFDTGTLAGESYTFPTATSASLLVTSFLNSPPSNNVVTWRLGTNVPGIPGETLSSGRTAGIYGFRGANTTEFSKYSITDNVWAVKATPANGIEKGGSLTIDPAAGIIYALEGNSKVFYKYVIATNTWSPATGGTALAQPSDNVGEGGAVQYLSVGVDKYVFALLGNSNRFRRYSIAGNSWSNMANTPATIKKGGSLTTDGTTYIYALQGNTKTSKRGFYRYNVAGNSWTTLTEIPVDVGWGGSLTYIGGNIYALQGNTKTGFYRYNVSGNTWTKMKDTPGNVSDGGALTNDGTYIYAFQGKTRVFWRYDITTNTWTTLAAAGFTGNVGQGGALVYDAGDTPVGYFTVMRANRSLVSTGDVITLTLEVRSSTAVTGVAPTAVTVTATNGASATLSSGPTPASQNIPAGGTVSFTWTYTATAGTSSPGILKFTAGATGNGGGPLSRPPHPGKLLPPRHLPIRHRLPAPPRYHPIFSRSAI